MKKDKKKMFEPIHRMEKIGGKLPKHLTILESGCSVVSSIGRSCATDQLHFNKTIVEIMKIAESVFIVLGNCFVVSSICGI